MSEETIDLGDNPTGVPLNDAQANQIRIALGLGETDDPSASGLSIGGSSISNDSGGLVFNSQGDFFQFNAATIAAASSTEDYAGLNISHGLDPLSPNNGDIWTTSDGISARINGESVQLATRSTNTFLGAQTFVQQVQLEGQSATDGNSAMTRDLVDQRTLAFPRPTLGGIPPIQFFDDFVTQSGSGSVSRLTTWEPIFGSSNGSFLQSSKDGSDSLKAFGIVEVSADANETFTTGFNGVHYPANLVGTRIEAVLAFDDLANCKKWFGVYGGGFSLKAGYDSAVGGNIIVVDSTAGTHNTGIAATTGDFISGDRWRVILERLTATTTRVTLEKAAWNSSSWSQPYNSVWTHSSSVGGWSMGPILSVQSTTAATKSCFFDYIALTSSITR